MGVYGKYDLIVGIDPGQHTGICVWDPKEKRIVELATVMIHEAILRVADYFVHKNILVRIEDARLRHWYGNNAQEKLQGAGSIKRDCRIWEDYLYHANIPFELVPPKNIRTKLSKLAFRKMTGYGGRTSSHSRDAGMLVFGL